MENINDVPVEKIKETIELAAKGELKKAGALIRKIYCENYELEKLFTELIEQYKDETSRENIYKFAVQLVKMGKKEWIIVRGLFMLEAFPEKQDELKELFIKSTKRDGLLYYILKVVDKWQNGDEIGFEIIKSTNYYRRDAMDFFKNITITDEMREWLLVHGADDYIDMKDAYFVYINAGVEEALQRECLTDEEFNGIGEILYAFSATWPGNVWYSFTHVCDWEKVTKQYIDHMSQREFTESELMIMDKLFEAVNETGEEESISEYFREKILNDKVEDLIIKKVSYGMYYDTAKCLKLDYEEKLLDMLEKDFDSHHMGTLKLWDDKKNWKRLIEIYEKNIDSRTITYDLNAVVGRFIDYPGLGTRLVKKMFESKDVYGEMPAIAVLIRWCSKTQKSLKEFDSDLYNSAKKYYENMSVDYPHERIKKSVLERLLR